MSQSELKIAISALQDVLDNCYVEDYETDDEGEEHVITVFDTFTASIKLIDFIQTNRNYITVIQNATENQISRAIYKAMLQYLQILHWNFKT